MGDYEEYYLLGYVTPSATCLDASISLSFFDPQDGGDMLL
jgi:hypothetical protein